MPETLNRMDSLPITRLHVFAGVVCACAFAADLTDMSIGSALTAVFSAPPYRMEPHRLGWLISSVYAGAVIGAPVLGWLADRRGVRRILVTALAWLSLTSFFAAASANSTWLFSVRFLAGLSLGALPPLIVAYLTAIAPPRYRGLYIFWVAAVSFLAAPATIFTVRWLTPLHPFAIEGWRWPFGIAGLLSLGSSLLLVRLPESPRWLQQAGRHGDAMAASAEFEGSARFFGAPVGVLPVEASMISDGVAQTKNPPTGRDYRSRFAVLTTMHFLYPWGSLGFSLLTGPILLARGYDLKDTLLFVGMATFGPTLSTLLAGTLIDRIERRTALVLCLSLMLGAALTFFNFLGVGWLTTAVIAFGIGAGFYVPLQSTYGAEIFPTVVRGSTTATAWAVGRAASVLVPIVVIPLLRTAGPQAVAKWVYLALASLILLVLTLGPRGATSRAVG
jgi:MFS transporter, putative metabolite:H+ symporter